jgi:molybdopterin-guanine dinucleotide biosynthesis protein A
MTAPYAIAASDITGLVLAGGRGSRMGGVDKGLQNFNGTPLALNAVLRLGMQVGEMMVNANRNLSAYESFGVPVWPDGLADYAGPLAGFLTGLERCETPYLLTVPCDTPLFPLDLAGRLSDALVADGAEIAMVNAQEAADEPGGATVLRPQPVFCLLGTTLLESLVQFTQGGGRKIDKWTAQHRTVLVPFDRPGDAPDAFYNANTLAELHALEGSARDFPLMSRIADIAAAWPATTPRRSASTACRPSCPPGEPAPSARAKQSRLRALGRVLAEDIISPVSVPRTTTRRWMACVRRLAARRSRWPDDAR